MTAKNKVIFFSRPHPGNPAVDLRDVLTNAEAMREFKAAGLDLILFGHCEIAIEPSGAKRVPPEEWVTR
jgi:hypothetical protein